MNIKLLVFSSLLTFVISTTLFPSIVALPHPIYGFAFYSDGNPAADATVYVLNLNNSEHISTNVLVNGEYVFDTGSPSPGWKEGEILLITIIQETNKTYLGWKGDSTITIDYGQAYQELPPIILNPPSSESYPPLPPERPLGSLFGYINESYYYTTTTVDPNGDKVYYWFDWGDDTNSGWLGPYPSGGTVSAAKTWTTPGNYNIRVRAKDIHGKESTWSQPLAVTITSQNITSQDQEENVPPIAQFTYSPTIPTTTNIYFKDHSIDYDGTIISWYWDFGDGTNSTMQHPHHMYPDNGIYEVTLTIYDDKNASNTTIQCIVIANNPPFADFTYLPDPPQLTTPIQFIDKSTDLDGTIMSWHWDFGDGYTSSEQSPTHVYTIGGTYQVMLKVTDDDNDIGIKTLYITMEEEFAILQGIIKTSEETPVDNATLYIYDVNTATLLRITKTNTTGMYTISNIPPGIYDIEVRKEGYYINKKTSQILKPGKNTFDFILITTTRDSNEVTPGFEFILVICALVLIFFWKRKIRD